MLARILPWFLLAVLGPLAAAAADLEGKPAASSTSFCLFELPADPLGQRFLNLGHVQYIEIHREEVRIAYGGGNLGAGYEARIPIKNREEGMAIIRRMQMAARECR